MRTNTSPGLDEVDSYCRFVLAQFFQAIPQNHFKWDIAGAESGDVSSALNPKMQTKILKETVSSDLASVRPPPAGYPERFLKMLNERVEEAGEEASDELLETLMEHLSNPAPMTFPPRPGFKSYLLPDRSITPKFVTLIEDSTFISGLGTTGLRTWGAGLRFAGDYLAIEKPKLGRSVVELGAGTGLCGIVCAVMGCIEQGGTLVLSDADERVLARLREHVDMNDKLMKVQGVRVAVNRLDWEEFCTMDHIHEESVKSYRGTGVAVDDDDPFLLPPGFSIWNVETVICSDVTYHPELLEPLLGTIRIFLRSPSESGIKKQCLVALMRRNEDTYALLVKLVADFGMVVEEIYDVSNIGYRSRQQSEAHSQGKGAGWWIEEALPVEIWRLV
ncbi:hypothetical protein BJ742DRAFT_792086, partial [Cladochytrium replicatum]